MNNKLINRLVQESITDNNLDKEKIDDYANRLSRENLKKYIMALRKWIKEHTIYVEYATEPSNELKKEFEKIYEGKRVVFLNNPDLLIGLRITDNDTIYEMNLHNTMRNMKNYIVSNL